jgi:hypothetical protein
VANWLSAVINGHCCFTRTRSMIQRTLGTASSETVFWFGCVTDHILFPAFVPFTSYFQAFKHIFTSPSSVEKEVKATRSGNARIHGMTRVTTASLAYVATQVRLMFDASPVHHLINGRQLRFALSSSSVFCKNDTSTDSERFYESVLDFLDHPEEQDSVRDLLRWWNS